MNLYLILITALIQFAFQSEGFAYPHYIGYGYPNCSNCHFNPMGNGPLTDYGRALWASTLAAKPLFQSKLSDEKLADQSAFLGTVKLPYFIKPSINFRELYLKTGLGTDSSRSSFTTMVADANLVLTNKKGNLFASATLGLLPKAAGQTTMRYISREHYIAFRPIKKLGFYLGHMDVAFGIRLPDHNAYSRSQTLLAQNDQTTGLLVHGSYKKWEGAVHGFIGNPLQAADLRLKGFSGTAEYQLGDQFVVGPSIYYAKNDYRKRLMFETHMRIGTGYGSSLLSELGFIQETTNGGDSTLGNYILIQDLYYFSRGLNYLMSFNYYTKKAFSPEARKIQLGPGLQYLPFQRLELRTDLLFNHTFAGPSAVDDILSLLLQAHLWL